LTVAKTSVLALQTVDGAAGRSRSAPDDEWEFSGRVFLSFVLNVIISDFVGVNDNGATSSVGTKVHLSSVSLRCCSVMWFNDDLMITQLLLLMMIMTVTYVLINMIGC